MHVGAYPSYHFATPAPYLTTEDTDEEKLEKLEDVIIRLEIELRGLENAHSAASMRGDYSYEHLVNNLKEKLEDLKAERDALKANSRRKGNRCVIS